MGHSLYTTLLIEIFSVLILFKVDKLRANSLETTWTIITNHLFGETTPHKRINQFNEAVSIAKKGRYLEKSNEVTSTWTTPDETTAQGPCIHQVFLVKETEWMEPGVVRRSYDHP